MENTTLRRPSSDGVGMSSDAAAETTPLVSGAAPLSNFHESPATVDYGTNDVGSNNNNNHPFKSLSNSVRDSFHAFSERFSGFVEEHTGSIGYLGSLSIAANSLTGPAMLNLPAAFTRSGIVPTLFTLIFVCVLSALCCLHMSNTISKVPDNLNFKQEVEYSEVFRHFWGRKWFVFTQILFFCCIICLNISSIVDTAQVVDTFLGHWFPGGSAAVAVHSARSADWVRWDYSGCTEMELLAGHCVPFYHRDGILLTAGTLITTAVFLPLALMDLKENARWQVVGFLVLLITSVQFIIEFAIAGVDVNNAVWWGDTSDLFGVVLFNFALVVAIPAWLYEREPHVDVPQVVVHGSALSVVLYVAIGVLGSLAIPNVADNMLASMMTGMLGTSMQLGASIFAFAIIGLGIPLFSVLARLNLTGSGLCTRNVGNALAVYFPFAASWLLYDGKAIVTLLAWGGTFFTSMVAFLLPIVLTLHVVKDYDAEGSISVYFGHWASKRAQINSLTVLLVLTVASILIAIIGTVLN